MQLEQGLAAASAAPPPRIEQPTRSSPRPQQPAERANDAESTRFRKGAVRMLESLGRMHPLRLTKGQWGTVAHLKTSGGTWFTYLGELRRAGLIEENTAGFTLTPAGFDFIGGQPAPMTSEELIKHYRSILRFGASGCSTP